MALDRTLRLVVVTPERTLLDEVVTSLRLPLYDGSIGILPGRLPLIGRLGFGELRVTTAAGLERRYFVDGGFVQVEGSTVSLLTNRCVPVEQINAAAVEQQLQELRNRPTHNEAETAARNAEQQRARRMLAVARHG